MRGALVLIVLLALVVPCMAQPAMPSLESSPLAVKSGFIITEWQAYVGQKLQVTVKVTNAPGAGELNGFMIIVGAVAPSGSTYGEKYVFDDVVPPGGSVTKVLNTNIVLNEVGKWTIQVTLLSKDGSQTYDSDVDYVNVVSPDVSPPPQPGVEIVDITGIAGFLAVGAVIGYFASRYY